MNTLLALVLLPLHFEPNVGQTDMPAQYVARGSGYEVALDGAQADIRRGKAAFTLRFRGANPDAEGEALEPQRGMSNYLIGANPTGWRQHVPHFGRVRYRGIYPGIDLVYHGRREALEYDLVVAAGADTSRIRLEFEGARKVRLTPTGDLAIETPGGEIQQRRPVARQDGRSVDCRYLVRPTGVQLKLGRYDHARPLVIDPILSLEYSLPSPGANVVAVDSSGSTYVAGSGSTSLYTGLVIAKLTPAGDALLYSTYIVSPGSPFVAAFGIAVDGAGNVYLGGETLVPGFPVTPGAFQTTQPQQGTVGFVLKLDRSGSLVYSTLLGGSSGPFSPGTSVQGIAADGAGNVYAAGFTSAAGIPPTSGALQRGLGGFLVKLNPTGSALVYSASVGNVTPHGLATDTSGNAFVVGGNEAPLAVPGHAFVMKVNPAGSALVYEHDIAGSGTESAAAVAVDSSGNAYVTGSTNSQDFPTTAGALQPKPPGPPCPPPNPKGPPVPCSHGFVSKLGPDGQFVYSTYLGGSGADNSEAIAVDGAGEAYVAGNTSSSDFPAAIPLRAFGGEVGFLAKLNAGGNALRYSTPFGANNATGAVGLALDGAGNAYIAGANLVAKIAVVPGPKIASAGVVNGASLLPGPLAPGEIITIFGAGLGPVMPATPTADSSGSIGTSVGGTRVLVGGIPAPVLYAQANQVNAIVPLGVAGTLASVAVINQGTGAGTPPVDVLLAPVAPAIFAADGSGAGPAAILNQDGKLNTPLDPAQQGEFIAIYGTGGGQTTPPESDGQMVTGTPKLTLPVEVTIGGLSAEVAYAGGAPTLVAGTIQVNARVPANTPTGPGVPITLTIGGVTSAPTVTIAVRAAPL